MDMHMAQDIKKQMLLQGFFNFRRMQTGGDCKIRLRDRRSYVVVVGKEKTRLV